MCGNHSIELHQSPLVPLCVSRINPPGSHVQRNSAFRQTPLCEIIFPVYKYSVTIQTPNCASAFSFPEWFSHQSLLPSLSLSRLSINFCSTLKVFWTKWSLENWSLAEKIPDWAFRKAGLLPVDEAAFPALPAAEAQRCSLRDEQLPLPAVLQLLPGRRPVRAVNHGAFTRSQHISTGVGPAGD